MKATSRMIVSKYIFKAFISSIVLACHGVYINVDKSWLTFDDQSATRLCDANHNYYTNPGNTKAIGVINNKKTANDSLRRRLTEVIQSCNANIGMSVFHIEKKETISIKGHDRFPMLSVYKFPIALTVLDLVDKKKIRMKKQIPILPDLIHPYEKELILSVFPGGKARIEDLLSLMLVHGSNTACDILLKEIGGPQVANRYMRKIGIDSMAIINTEAEIQKSPDVKYKNWCTPNEIVRLLLTSFERKILSAKSYSFLWTKMTETNTGSNRLKGLLPKEATIAHRTGTSSDVYNDVGIITLPNNEHVAIAVFMSDAKDEPKKAEQIIARIGKCVWDHYCKSGLI
ncbi:MAG TPA: class A beta-lactamase [Chitinophagaceae bacterium]